MPPSYWAEALATATYLRNILPTKTLGFGTLHFALHKVLLFYDHLRIFGFKCYPNLSASAANKLAVCSTMCIFLGYSPYHKGYRCLDFSTNKVIISRHISFDESSFPYVECGLAPSLIEYEFLDDCTTNVSRSYWTVTPFSSCRIPWRCHTRRLALHSHVRPTESLPRCHTRQPAPHIHVRPLTAR